jgi:hypothetical protein
MNYQVTRDGEVLSTGTEYDCWVFILRYQSQSVEWAIQHEGYKILPVSKKHEPKNEQ